MGAKISKTVSKLLSFVLRHHPQLIGLDLDKKGWANVDLLLRQLNAHGASIDYELLNYVVETNNKKRSAFNEDKTLIRASQGHSIAHVPVKFISYPSNDGDITQGYPETI